MSSSKTKAAPVDDDPPQPLLEHLTELRRRLLWSLVALLAMFPLCYAFAEEIYGFLLKPLAKAYGAEGSDKRLIYTGLTEAFFVYIKTALYTAFMLSFPLILIQIWKFVAPGLYKHERRLFRPFLLATPLLFLLGAAMAYYIIIPLAWDFFLSFENRGSETALPIELEARVSEYLSLVMTLLFAFGVSFELPVLLLILGLLGIVTPEMLARGRRYAIVIMLVIAAIITPPDVISQIGLAVPMYALYELSLLMLRWLLKKRTLAVGTSATE